MKTSTLLLLIALVVILFVYLASPEIQKDISPTFFWLFMAFGVFRLVMSLISDRQTAELNAQISEKQKDAKDIAGAEDAGNQSRVPVTVYRLSNFVGSLNPMYVFCDEQPIANLKNGSYAICRVSPGQHVFSSSASTLKITMNIDPAQEYFIRSGITGLASSVFTLASKDQAQQEMKTLKRMDPNA